MNKAPRYMKEYVSTIKKSAEAYKKRFNHENVDGTYRDAEGTGRDYAYKLREIGFDFSKYSFTIFGILAFLSDVTGNDYTELEFCN